MYALTGGVGTVNGKGGGAASLIGMIMEILKSGRKEEKTVCAYKVHYTLRMYFFAINRDAT